MREILFRGKTLNGNEWIIGAGVYKSEGYTWTITDDVTKTENRGTGSDAIISETIGQFTGLADKNGKQIFEGDIVEPMLVGGTHKGFSWGRQVVVFDRGAFGLKSRREEITPMCNYAANVQFEVFGNIHDNPELLEAQ